jgi:hypothetical protein
MGIQRPQSFPAKSAGTQAARKLCATGDKAMALGWRKEANREIGVPGALWCDEGQGGHGSDGDGADFAHG